MLKIVNHYDNPDQSIALAQQNNRKAQNYLFERYAPKMLNICSYYIRNTQSAEEVLLTGFLKAFTKINQYQNKGSFEGWLRKIIVREALSYIRSNKTHEINYLEDVASQPRQEPSMDWVSEEELQKLVRQLPENYRIVFLLFVVEGYVHKEISKQLGIPINTSKSYLLRARKILQHHVLKLEHVKDEKVKI